MQPCRRVHISFEFKKIITRKLQNSRQNDKVRVFTSLPSVSSLLRETRHIVPCVWTGMSFWNLPAKALVYRRVWRLRKWRGVQGVPLQDIRMSWLLLAVSGVFF